MVKLFGDHAYFWILCWAAIMVVWILWDIKKTLEDISGDLGRILLKLGSDD